VHRRLVAPDRHLQRAAADVEDQEVARRPAEPAAHGEEGQRRLVRPGEHLQVDLGLVADPLEHGGRVGGVAHRGGRERQQVLAPELEGLDARLGHGIDERVGTLVAEPSVADVLGQPQGGLGGVGRRRVPAALGVDHQQVHGVRTDVEHTESHEPTLAGSTRRACNRVPGR
jgi:hypothetical protein